MCTHAAYYFLNHLVCIFLGVLMLEEILALGLQKNTDYLFCMNTLKVNSGNCCFNSASALCWAVHWHFTTHVLPPNSCSLSAGFYNTVHQYSTLRTVGASQSIFWCACTETIWKHGSWSQNTCCFFISQLQESERVSRTLIYTRCFKVRWKIWCHESFPTATNWPCYSEQACSACGRLQA